MQTLLGFIGIAILYDILLNEGSTIKSIFNRKK